MDGQRKSRRGRGPGALSPLILLGGGFAQTDCVPSKFEYRQVNKKVGKGLASAIEKGEAEAELTASSTITWWTWWTEIKSQRDAKGDTDRYGCLSMMRIRCWVAIKRL